MDTKDRKRYMASLQECVAIATRNGYTPEQVATDIRILSTPPQKKADVEVYVKLDF